MRRSISRVGEGVMARRGVLSCVAGLAFLAVLPHLVADSSSTAVIVLRTAAVCLAFTSATVVNSLTALASLQCDDTSEHPKLAKGEALGHFRSSGQLGRAIGPLLGKNPLVACYTSITYFCAACASYWTFGPSITYGISGVAMFFLASHMKSIEKTKLHKE